MLILKQATVQTVKIGPFLDDTDGVTAEEALTIEDSDIRLSKNGGTMADKTETTTCTHDELGYYNCFFDATDTGTLGSLQLMVKMAGAAPVWHNYMVIEPDLYDIMYSTGILEGTLSLSEALRIILAALAGKLSGGGTTTRYIRDVADTKPRITATIDTSGNRTAVTLDGT